ncbi:unnamed protein product [Phytophthora fragariaefolia]|uniref:Unnamed protein product n=1 Tax=Phytophthora fragariaefolia TaxID=1490495 RepID=A0A9W6UER0_9STRA|nr:unnamed protein product [Phytophthora fragariaefolia]
MRIDPSTTNNSEQVSGRGHGCCSNLPRSSDNPRRDPHSPQPQQLENELFRQQLPSSHRGSDLLSPSATLPIKPVKSHLGAVPVSDGQNAGGILANQVPLWSRLRAHLAVNSASIGLAALDALPMAIIQDDEEAVLTEVVPFLPAPGLQDDSEGPRARFSTQRLAPRSQLSVRLLTTSPKPHRPRSRRRQSPRKRPRRSVSTCRPTPSLRSRTTWRASSRLPVARTPLQFVNPTLGEVNVAGTTPRCTSSCTCCTDGSGCGTATPTTTAPSTRRPPSVTNSTSSSHDRTEQVPELQQRGLLEQAQLVDPTRPAHQRLTDKALARIKLDVCTTPPPVSTWVGNRSRGPWKALFCDVRRLGLQRKIAQELSVNKYTFVYNDKKFRPTEQEDDDSDFEEDGEYPALPPTPPVTLPTATSAEDSSPDEEEETPPRWIIRRVRRQRLHGERQGESGID